MSWHWNDRDLLGWSKSTLPEFLLESMRDPRDHRKVSARTPWECFEIAVVEAEIDGEVTLTGKQGQPLLVFDLDMGMRVHITKQVEYATEDKPDGVVASWTGIVQLSHFEKDKQQPEIVTKLDDVHEGAAQEVEWFMKQGMGKRYIWHALARWHAHAVKRWCNAELEKIEDPHLEPVEPPDFPPFKLVQRLENNMSSDLSRGLVEDIRHLAVEDVYESSSMSEDEDDAGEGEWELDQHTMQFRRKGSTPNMKKFSRYPFLPSMISGVGGPATDWLPPKDCAIGHPEWQSSLGSREKGRLSALDMVLDSAKRKREEMEKLANGGVANLRALELCQAIEHRNVLKAFDKLEEQTVNCPHPETGRCALHYCVISGHEEILHMVLATRADINFKDAFGQTPLMLAAQQGHTEVARLLLDAGADVTEEDALGRSAADMVKVLKVDEDDPLKNWRHKMDVDAVPDDPTKRKQDLRAMIDERLRPKKYSTMLLSALSGRDARTAESAIEAGADVNLVDERGDSAMLLLARGKWRDREGLQIRLAEKILKAGGFINFQNVGGNTPLLYAVHRGSERFTEELLRLKANTDLTNSEGNTALMYAANGGHENICKQLLKASASPSVKNVFGLTAQHMAEKKGFQSCAMLIKVNEAALEELGNRKQEPFQFKAVDYSRWDALEKEMAEEELAEEATRIRETQLAMKRPAPKAEDLGPGVGGLHGDTPWPARHTTGPFDYSRWNKICDDVERMDKVEERYEYLQKNPQYEWRDGQKCRVIF